MYKIFLTFILSILILQYASATTADEAGSLIPPADFQAFDTSNDDGKSISLRWPSSPSESAEVEYVVYASLHKDGAFVTEVLRISSKTMYEEGSDSNFHYVEIKPGKFFNKDSDVTGGRSSYFFRLVMMSNSENVTVNEIASATPKGNWLIGKS